MSFIQLNVTKMSLMFIKIAVFFVGFFDLFNTIKINQMYSETLSHYFKCNAMLNFLNFLFLVHDYSLSIFEKLLSM